LRKAGREKRVLGDEPEIAVSVRVAADKQADSSLLTLRGAQIPFWPHTTVREKSEAVSELWQNAVDTESL
jgi:hypothetical protein